MKVYLVNGFLGSGKTTAIQHGINLLLDKQVAAGVITNDQGVQLVDSKLFEQSNIPVCEVTGGCFCCNYDQLDEHLISWEKSEAMDVIFAESVGSCTDLISTVVRPLMHYHPALEVHMSAFADARILPVLLQEESFFFDDEIHYIYQKQLEEADVLVVNKVDLLQSKQLQEIKSLISAQYPQKKVLYQNSLSSEHIEDWLQILNRQPPNNRSMLEIDYDVYGTGETKLGWLDAELKIEDTKGSAWPVAYGLINKMNSKISEASMPIGHLKFFINDENEHQKVSITSAGTVDIPRKERNAHNITLLINARVQANSDRLQQILKEVIDETQMEQSIQVIPKKIESFQPGLPKPVHKMID